MAEVFKIGIEIALAGSILQGLEAISSKLLGINAKVKDVEGGLKRWGLAIGGAAALMGAEKLFKGFEHIVEHGAKLEHYEAQLLASGVSMEDVGKATAAAWDNVAHNINASAADSLKNIIELRQATGSLGEAMRMLPAFTKTEFALSSLKDEGLRQHAAGKGQSYDFARSLELLAVTQDEKKLDSYIASMTREFIGMRGLVDGHNMMVALQNAGGARYGWNEDFVGHVLGPLIQENPRNATGLYQLDRSFGSGVMTEMMAHGAEKYGLFEKKDEYRDAHGRWKGMQTGSIAGYDLMRANPEEWAEKVVLPLFKSHGVNIDDTNQMAKAIQEVSRGNKNLGVILDALLLPANRSILAKERGNIDQVPNDAADVLQKHDPMLAMKAFTEAWDNLLTALGKPMVATAADGLRQMASAMDSVAVWFADHPTAAAAVSQGMLALSAGLAALGTAAVLGAAVAFVPGGVAAVAIIGIAGAIAALGAINWRGAADHLQQGYEYLKNRNLQELQGPAPDFTLPNKIIQAIGDLFSKVGVELSAGINTLQSALASLPSKALSAMDSVAQALSSAIASIPGKVVGAISGMASGLASEIGNALRSLVPGGGGKPAGTGEPGGGAFTPGAYHVPGGGAKQPIHLQTAVNLDGKTLARASSKYLAALNTHPRQAPYSDPSLGYSSLDWATATS